MLHSPFTGGPILPCADGPLATDQVAPSGLTHLSKVRAQLNPVSIARLTLGNLIRTSVSVTAAPVPALAHAD